MKQVLPLKLFLGMFMTDHSFAPIILKANNSSLLFDSRYMCRQTIRVSISFCHLLKKLSLNSLSCNMNCFSICSLRGQLNALQEASGGKRISVNDLVIKV